MACPVRRPQRGMAVRRRELGRSLVRARVDELAVLGTYGMAHEALVRDRQKLTNDKQRRGKSRKSRRMAAER
jgi:hypothetical protein